MNKIKNPVLRTPGSKNAGISQQIFTYLNYSYNATLPDGTKLYDTAVTVSPGCVVERKMSLDELAACFCKGRSRFTKEFERARESGARIYLIVENASWENLLNGKYRTREP